MNDFQLPDLNSFFELMAALNLAPSLFNPLIESYIKIFQSTIRKNKVRLRSNLHERVYGIQDKLVAEATEAIQKLPMDEGSKEEIKEKIDREKEVVKGKMVIVLENVVIAFDNYLIKKEPKFRKRILDNVPRLRTSFLSAGLFCIVMLLLPPLSTIFLGNLGYQLTYFHALVLCFMFSGFQVYYLFKDKVALSDVHVTIISGAALVFMVAVCCLSHLLLPYLPESYGLFKFTVVLSLITACLSYILYTAKFRLLVRCQMRIVEKHYNDVIDETIKQHVKGDHQSDPISWKDKVLDWFIEKYSLES